LQPFVGEQSHVILHPHIGSALRLLQTFLGFASIVLGSIFDHFPITFPARNGSMNDCSTEKYGSAPTLFLLPEGDKNISRGT
jgi:hypothetical protein